MRSFFSLVTAPTCPPSACGIRDDGLDQRVRVTGFREGGRRLMGLIDVYLMTSAYEGLPIAMLEAMALAKPVVATAAGGIPEVIVPGREGLLAPVGDVNLLAAQVNALLVNPHAAAEMGRAGRSKVEGRYHTRTRARHGIRLPGDLESCTSGGRPRRAGQWPEPCPMTDLYILDWTDESIPRLLELSRATLGAGGAVAKTVAFWRWKHCDNPFGRSYGVYVMDTAPRA